MFRERLLILTINLFLTLSLTGCGRIWGGVAWLNNTVVSNSLAYSCNYEGFLVGTPVTPYSPISLGTGSYSVAPALPTGLTLNSTTGIISGTPTVTTPLTAYTVSAHASSGATAATTINIQTDSGYLVNDLVHDSDTAGAGCTSGFGTCTIRAAIDSPSPPNLIILPAGTTTITLGTLSVSNPMSIYGDCAHGTIIDGNNSNKILAINAATSLYNFTLQHGNTVGIGGGAMDIDGGIQTTVVNFNFLNNNVTGGSVGGAILAWAPSNLTVIGSTFYNNTADAGGGAIAIGAAAGAELVTLINDTFNANSSAEGGAIFGGSYTITNSTFSQNTTSGCCTSAIVSDSTVNFTNTLFYGNTGGFAENCSTFGGGVFTSLGNNLTDNDGTDCNMGGTDIVNTSALLGPLQNNGGLTLTESLLTGSPGIDQGNTTACSTTDLSVDARGYPRLVDGKCDIGAYESSP